MTPPSRARPTHSRTHPAVMAFRVAGIACVVLAIVTFAVGLAIFLTGYEIAFLLLIVALGVFALGIGFLAAARRLS